MTFALDDDKTNTYMERFNCIFLGTTEPIYSFVMRLIIRRGSD